MSAARAGQIVRRPRAAVNGHDIPSRQNAFGGRMDAFTGTAWLVVMAHMCSIRGSLDAAIHLVGFVPLYLDLHRRVIDAMVVLQFFDHGLENLLSLPNALLSDQNVTATGNGPRSHRPHVKIVNTQDARRGRDTLLNCRHIHSVG